MMGKLYQKKNTCIEQTEVLVFETSQEHSKTIEKLVKYY